MKVQKLGRRRIKIEQTQMESESDIGAYFNKHGRVQPDGSVALGYDLSEVIEILERNAKAVLKKAGLPDQVIIIHDTGWTNVSSFVRDKGYEHDSAEGLAADILVSAKDARHLDEKKRMEAVFRLGELRTKAKIYGIEHLTQSQSGKTGGKGKTGHKAPLTVAIYEMAQKIPNCSYYDLLAEMDADAQGQEGLLYNLREQGLITVRFVSVTADQIQYDIVNGKKGQTLSISSLSNKLSEAKKNN